MLCICEVLTFKNLLHFCGLLWSGALGAPSTRYAGVMCVHVLCL